MVERRDPGAEAKKYLDDAILRHRQFGDDQGSVPRSVYDRALSRTTRTVREFERLGRKARRS
jgi:hypothetical protein